MIKKMMLTVMALGFAAMCAGASDPSHETTPSEEEHASVADKKLHTDMLVLDGVGNNHVTFCNRIYEVGSHTTIRNERGTTIALESLDTPCKAMVSYFKKKGAYHRYIAMVIEVRGEVEPVPE